jgi:hypothetical protein
VQQATRREMEERRRERMCPRLLLELPRLGARAPWETRQAAGVPSPGSRFAARVPHSARSAPHPLSFPRSAAADYIAVHL